MKLRSVLATVSVINTDNQWKGKCQCSRWPIKGATARRVAAVHRGQKCFSDGEHFVCTLVCACTWLLSERILSKCQRKPTIMHSHLLADYKNAANNVVNFRFNFLKIQIVVMARTTGSLSFGVGHYKECQILLCCSVLLVNVLSCLPAAFDP